LTRRSPVHQGGEYEDTKEGSRGGATTYYEVDGLGSVTSLTSAAVTLAQTYTGSSRVDLPDVAENPTWGAVLRQNVIRVENGAIRFA
jgi:hypothetical protein